MINHNIRMVIKFAFETRVYKIAYDHWKLLVGKWSAYIRYLTPSSVFPTNAFTTILFHFAKKTKANSSHGNSQHIEGLVSRITKLWNKVISDRKLIRSCISKQFNATVYGLAYKMVKELDIGLRLTENVPSQPYSLALKRSQNHRFKVIFKTKVKSSIILCWTIYILPRRMYTTAVSKLNCLHEPFFSVAFHKLKMRF